MKKSEFWSLIVSELIAENFSVLLYNNEHLDGWGGWLDASLENKEFVVAMNHPLGFETALHEYCHFLQWKNNPKLWNKSETTYGILFDWIDNPESNYTTEELQESLHDILEIEHDCEKLALDFASMHNLENFDYNLYAQAANAYLWHYHINRIFRKKSPIPIYNTDITKYMSKNLNSDLSFYLDIKNLGDKEYNKYVEIYSQYSK